MSSVYKGGISSAGRLLDEVKSIVPPEKDAEEKEGSGPPKSGGDLELVVPNPEILGETMRMEEFGGDYNFVVPVSSDWIKNFTDLELSNDEIGVFLTEYITSKIKKNFIEDNQEEKGKVRKIYNSWWYYVRGLFS